MNKLPSLILRLLTLPSAAAATIVCIFILPRLGTEIVQDFPVFEFFRYPLIVGLYATAMCFFYALYQLWLLLNAYDRDGTLAAKHLRGIRNSAILFCVLYAICAMPMFFLAAEADDAPGLILFGMLLDSIPLGAAAVAEILQRSFEVKIG